MADRELRGPATGPASQSGKGFGLFISYEVLKYYNGHLTIESRKNEGTTVRLYLPVSRQAPGARMMDKGTVLIVDDEPNALRVLSAILQEEGYAVREAMDVDQAMAVHQDERVDAVITDIRMPVRDGFHLFDYIRKHHAGIPVMFLTAFGTVESAVEADHERRLLLFHQAAGLPEAEDRAGAGNRAAQEQRDLTETSGSGRHPDPLQAGSSAKLRRSTGSARRSRR